MKSNITNSRCSNLLRKGLTFLFICCSFGSLRALNLRRSVPNRKNRTELHQTCNEDIFQPRHSDSKLFINSESIYFTDQKTDLFINYIDSFEYLNTYQYKTIAVIDTFYHHTDIPPWI